MSRLDIKIPHKLPGGIALIRVKQLLSDLQNQYQGSVRNVNQEWDGNEGKFSFNAKGFSFKGVILVGVDTVRISGRLPLILSVYKSKIESLVQTRGSELLAG